MYGFILKSEFPRILRQFIRDHGAPSILRRDNATEEKSEEVNEITNEAYIKNSFSEPYYPNQNPVEGGAIRYLKDATHVLLDRTGAPENTWYFACKYICDIHDRTSDPKLPGKVTPYQMGTGITPDISAWLQFTFWEAVLYLDTEVKWPRSKECPG